MTAFDNIAFGLKYRKVPVHEVERRVRQALEIVRLPHTGERLPRELSGGQQQRVAMARAIVIDPDLQLFDEPLSALDANLREEMRIELKRIHRTFGITTIFLTHDQGEALSMADCVVLMRDGHIEQEGPPGQLYRAPQSELRRALLRPCQRGSGDSHRRSAGAGASRPRLRCRSSCIRAYARSRRANPAAVSLRTRTGRAHIAE